MFYAVLQLAPEYYIELYSLHLGLFYLKFSFIGCIGVISLISRRFGIANIKSLFGHCFEAVPICSNYISDVPYNIVTLTSRSTTWLHSFVLAAYEFYFPTSEPHSKETSLASLTETLAISVPTCTSFRQQLLIQLVNIFNY